MHVVVDRFGKVHSLARQIDGVRTRELKKKLASIDHQLGDIDSVKADVQKRAAAAKARVDQRVNRAMTERAAKLSAQHKARRHKLDGRAQELATTHGAERMSLNAAHKSEAGKPFARAAGAIFALFDRVPGLRSVIAPLRRNPKINPAERHRIEREALERRHQRERLVLERRYKALGRLEARELRSLETEIRRQVYEAEAARELKAESLQDRIEVNKLDITLPHGELPGSDHKRWKARRTKVNASQRQN